MRRAIVAVAAIAGCAGSHFRQPPTPPQALPQLPAPSGEAVGIIPKPPTQEDIPPTDNVTEYVTKMNGGAFGKPVSQFRAGSVSALRTPPATQTASGFQVSFPSHALITTPTVYKEKVIVSGGFKSKELYAYEAKTGKPVWGLDLHDDGPSSAACERDVCVVSTESCTLFSISAATGALLWSYWLGDPLTSAPTIAGGRVFASYPTTKATGGQLPPGANHALAAFDLRTGKVVWQLWLDSDVMSAPVAVGDFVYVTTFSGTLIKAEQSTGKVRYAVKAKATSAPVVRFASDGVEQMFYTRRGHNEGSGAEEMIIRADHNHPQTKFSAGKKKADYIDSNAQAPSDYSSTSKSADAHNGFGSGAPPAAASKAALDSVGAGSVSSMQAFQGSRILYMGDRNINTMGDEVIATDTETGAKLWSFKLTGDTRKVGGFLGTAPLAAGGSVFFGTLLGDIVRVDPKSGKTTGIYAVGGQIRSQPVVENGWIYVGTADGKLVAINTKDPSITGWPTWGGNAQRTGIASR